MFPYHGELVMFRIVSALVLDVPESLTCLYKSWGISPNVLFSFEPWGHINHNGSACMCLSSDRTGAYIHGLSINPSEIVTGDGLGRWLIISPSQCLWEAASGYL